MSAFFHFWSPPICVSLALCKLQIFSNFKKWLCVLSMHDGYYVNTCVWACHTNYFFFFHLIFSVICSKCFFFLSYLTLFEIYYANIWVSSCLWLFYFLFPYPFSFFDFFLLLLDVSSAIFFYLMYIMPTLGSLMPFTFSTPLYITWHSHSHFIFTVWSYLYTL